MSEDTATAGPSTSEAVEELLRQLVDARFVLADRDGAVTRWSRPAEELFGWPAARMLGRPLAETLALEMPLPESGGQIQAVARRRDGQEIDLALTFVPVLMSQSLEFNGFLEALEIAAPRGGALAQLGRSHRMVVDWIQAAIAGEAQLEEDGFAAGTIVAFRALSEPPAPAPADDELGGDGSTAAAAGQIADAVEAALGRSEDIERVLERTTAELAAAREQADAARGEAAATGARLDQLERAGSVVESQLADTRRALEEMSAGVEALREELERGRREAGESQAEQERLRREDEQSQAEWVDEVHARIAKLEAAAESAPEAGAAAEAASAALGERLEARLTESEQERERAVERFEDELAATRALGEELRAAADAAERRAADAEEMAERRAAEAERRAAEAERRAAEVEETAERRAAEAEGRAAEAEQAAERRAADAAQAAAAAAEAAALARRSAEDAAVEADAVRQAGEEAAHGRGYEAPHPIAPYRRGAFADSANGAADATDPRRPLFAVARDTGPAREPRPGFDDAPSPMATIGLDGHFVELNQAFSDLVGYPEAEFRSATWPPVMDRANLPKHREQMEQMLAGEIDSADVNTGYVHAQGLMVPLAGTIRLVRKDGEPDHYLLEGRS